jgi:hypothetical protein
MTVFYIVFESNLKTGPLEEGSVVEPDPPIFTVKA